MSMRHISSLHHNDSFPSFFRWIVLYGINAYGINNISCQLLSDLSKKPCVHHKQGFAPSSFISFKDGCELLSKEF